jgi:hypothetical protein
VDGERLASTNESSAEISKPSDHWRMIMEDLTADHLAVQKNVIDEDILQSSPC